MTNKKTSALRKGVAQALSKNGGLLVANPTTQGVLFAELFDRPLTPTFGVPIASSDGGAVLIAAARVSPAVAATVTPTNPDPLPHATHPLPTGAKGIEAYRRWSHR